MITPPEEVKAEEKPFKRNLMGEFSALYTKTEKPHNFSCYRQISNECIEVELRQYPEQGITEDITIYDELNRLRYFGWQLRSIKYDKDGDLHLYFEKVDWRSVGFFNLIPNQYNNEQDLWWFDYSEPARPEGAL